MTAGYTAGCTTAAAAAGRAAATVIASLMTAIHAAASASAITMGRTNASAFLQRRPPRRPQQQHPQHQQLHPRQHQQHLRHHQQQHPRRSSADHASERPGCTRASFRACCAQGRAAAGSRISAELVCTLGWITGDTSSGTTSPQFLDLVNSAIIFFEENPRQHIRCLKQRED